MNTSTGREQLAQLFSSRIPSASWLSTYSHKKEFAGNGVYRFGTQGNDPSCTSFGCNVKMICEVMAGGPPSPPLNRLAKLVSGGNEVVEASEEPAEEAAADLLPNSPHAYLDYWGWQTCTEFGFYQTCEVGSKCFFTQGYNLLSDNDGFCQSDYGISPAEIEKSIKATNAYYGALRPDLAKNASRILYVNGDVDPWSGLGILKSPSPSLPILLVPGASHHAWTHPSKDGDQPSVIAARKTIRAQVTAWLKEA